MLFAPISRILSRTTIYLALLLLVKSLRHESWINSWNTALHTGKDFAELVIRTNPDGSRLLMRDIADIKDGFAEGGGMATFDGQPGISIQVQSVENESVLDISEQVNAYVNAKQNQMPDNVSIATWSDSSHYVRGRLEMMQRNMWQGALLVLLILTMFLRLRVAFWVMVGLPVAFLYLLSASAKNKPHSPMT